MNYLQTTFNSILQRFQLISIFALMLSWSMASGQGIIDLRSADFSTSQELDAPWEFYWERLTRTGSPNHPVHFELPQLWDYQVIDGDTITPHGYATYKIRLLLPKNEFDYGLFVDDLYCAYKLYVNGELIGNNGNPSNSIEDYVPEWRPQVYNLGKLDSEVELVLQVANFGHSKGGLNKSLELGEYKSVNRRYQTYIWLDVILTVLLLVLAFLFLIRFGFISLDFGSLYFSLFCIIYSYRIIGSGFYAIHSVLAGLSWETIIMMEYLSLYASPFFFARHLRELYPHDIYKPAVLILEIVSGIFVLVTLFAPPVVYTQLNNPFFVLLVGYFFYGFIVYLTGYLNHRPGSLYGLISALIVFTLFTFLILEYTGFLKSVKEFIFAAHILFVAFQSIQLFIYSRSRPLEEF